MELPPKVTVGLPVYNGMPDLEHALESLLAQDYPNLEIILSDNASTDGTEVLCRRTAASCAHVRYVRNPRNLGPYPNFLQTVELAQGEYFMWAAHDDLWNPCFVSALAGRLDQAPEAILATPRVFHVKTGDPRDRVYRTTPAASLRGRTGNLRALCRHRAAVWIYGLYRTAWLRSCVGELQSEGYPTLTADILWLASLTLRYPITGSNDAVLTKRERLSSFAPRTEADRLRLALDMGAHLTRMSRRYGRTRRERAAALVISWHYLYRRYLRGGNLLKVIPRLVMLPRLVWERHRWSSGLRRQPEGTNSA